MFAVDHRDRRAPVPLTGNEPVTQSVIDGFASNASFVGHFSDLLDRVFVIHAVELAGVDDCTFGSTGFFQIVQIDIRIMRIDNRDDLQTEFLSKVKVTLVVGRYAHDGAGSVTHQYVIRNENRHGLAGERIDRVFADEHTGLLICR